MVKTKIKYEIVKKNSHQKVVNLDILPGYDMSSRSKISGGINVKKINLINEELIWKMLKRKIDKRFKTLLEFIVSIDESDEDPSNALVVALTETDKLRKEVLNKYNRLLTKQQKEFIEKKIALIEKDVKMRLYNYQMQSSVIQQMIDEDEEVFESHRRR